MNDFCNDANAATNKGNQTMLVTLFIIALGIRVAFFTGLIGSDDLGYINNARGILEGHYRLTAHHDATRFGLLVPVAFFFRCFGTNEWSTVFVSLLSSSLAPPLIAVLTTAILGQGGWIAGLLLATFPLSVRYSTVLVPEPLLETTLIISVLLFVLADRRESILLGMNAGIVVGVSYLVKESGALLLLTLLVVCLIKRKLRLALSVACGFGFVAVVEIAWLWSLSGDPLFRLNALGTHNRGALALASSENFSYRLWKAYPRMILVPSVDFGLHSLLVIGLTGVALCMGRGQHLLLLSAWALLPYLYIVFGTSSFGIYVPIPPAPRYIGLIYAPLFILSEMVLSRWADTKAKRYIVVVLLLATFLIGIACAGLTQRSGYRTKHVNRLRAFAFVARETQNTMCISDSRDGKRWSQILSIIAPEQLGCQGPQVLVIVPDSMGMPTTVQSRIHDKRHY